MLQCEGWSVVLRRCVCVQSTAWHPTALFLHALEVEHPTSLVLHALEVEHPTSLVLHALEVEHKCTRCTVSQDVTSVYTLQRLCPPPA